MLHKNQRFLLCLLALHESKCVFFQSLSFSLWLTLTVNIFHTFETVKKKKAVRERANIYDLFTLLERQRRKMGKLKFDIVYRLRRESRK